MSKKKSISLVIIVAIICSVLSSLLTVVVVNKTGILNGTSNSQGTSSQIVINDDGKTTNVYQAVSKKALPSVVHIKYVQNSKVKTIDVQSDPFSDFFSDPFGGFFGRGNGFSRKCISFSSS